MRIFAMGLIAALALATTSAWAKGPRIEEVELAEARILNTALGPIKVSSGTVQMVLPSNERTEDPEEILRIGNLGQGRLAEAVVLAGVEVPAYSIIQIGFPYVKTREGDFRFTSSAGYKIGGVSLLGGFPIEVDAFKVVYEDMVDGIWSLKPRHAATFTGTVVGIAGFDFFEGRIQGFPILYSSVATFEGSIEDLVQHNLQNLTLHRGFMGQRHQYVGTEGTISLDVDDEVVLDQGNLYVYFKGTREVAGLQALRAITYNSKTGLPTGLTLAEETTLAPSNIVIDNAAVVLYPNGVVSKANPKFGLVQNVFGFPLLGYHDLMMFWPDGGVMQFHVQDKEALRFILEGQEIWAYGAELLFNPKGELRLIKLNQINGGYSSEYDKFEVRGRVLTRIGQGHPLQDEQLPSYGPGEKVIDWLESN